MSGLALALALAGCGGPHGQVWLPDGAVAVIALESGGSATVHVDLGRDRVGPRVRVAEGRLDLAPFGEVVRPDASGSAHHLGPGEGFHLRQVEDRLELLRPRGDEARWMPVLRGVGALESVVWVNTDRLSEGERNLLDARLKEVVPLDVERAAAVVDGDLAEWTGSAARPVERPSQVLAGAQSWSGPRDAAFGMAARWVGDGLVLALRIRDDLHVQGADRLEILAADRVIRLPLSDRAGQAEGPGWRAAFAEPDWLGQGLELWIAEPSPRALLERPPVIQLVDQDPDEAETRLGSAANADLGVLAAVR